MDTHRSPVLNGGSHRENNNYHKNDLNMKKKITREK